MFIVFDCLTSLIWAWCVSLVVVIFFYEITVIIPVLTEEVFNVSVDWGIEIVNVDFVMLINNAGVEPFVWDLALFIEAMVSEDCVDCVLADTVTCSGRGDDEVLATVELTLDVDEASTGLIIEEVEVFWLSFISSSCFTLLLALGGNNCEASCVSLLT